MVKLYGVSLSIIFDRGTKFTSQFWKSFLKGLGTEMKPRTVFHPQIYGQSEHSIKTMKNYVTSLHDLFKDNWDDDFPLSSF